MKMNHEYYEQVLSIKKTKSGLIKNLKTNKKFRTLFLGYLLVSFLIVLSLVFFTLKILESNLLIISVIFLTIILLIILGKPEVYTIAKSTSLKRRKELKTLLRLLNIVHSQEIAKIQSLVEHWTEQKKPEKFNWAIVLIFYSVIYTSFMNHLVIDLVKNFKFEYLLVLFFIAFAFHSLFYAAKSLIELLLFSKIESEFNFLMWVSGELKVLELEAVLKENKEKIH
jgi:hypothetical protein